MLRVVFKYSNIGSIHPYLHQTLSLRNFYPLRPFQQQALTRFNSGNNVMVNSCTGSGKTLAYLVPILNMILSQPKNKALILTLNSELTQQVEREVKSLDPQSRINTLRITTLNNINPNESQSHVNHLNWDQKDLLISTPVALSNIISIYPRQNQQLSPSFVAIDEADLLLELDRNVSKKTHEIIKTVRKATKQVNFIMTASSFPINYQRKPSQESLSDAFWPLTQVKGMSQHQFPPGLELLYVQIQEQEDLQIIHRQKLSYLSRIIKDRPKDRLMIFCRSKQQRQVVASYIRDKLKLDCLQLYAQMSSQDRKETVRQYDMGRQRLLVSSDLGGRGLDFSVPVDCVVEYDMAQNIVQFLNRAGRTARNGQAGDVVCFVQPKNQLLFQHIKAIKAQNSRIDSIFSRKRSLSKRTQKMSDDSY